MEQGSQHCSHGNPLLRPLSGVLKEERSLARDGVHLRRHLEGKRGFRESGGLGLWPPVTVVLEQGFWRRTFSSFILRICCSQLGWWPTQSGFLKEHFGFPVRHTFRISFIWICMIYDAQKYSLLIYFCIEIGWGGVFFGVFLGQWVGGWEGGLVWFYACHRSKPITLDVTALGAKCIICYWSTFVKKNARSTGLVAVCVESTTETEKRLKWKSSVSVRDGCVSRCLQNECTLL